MADAMSTTSTAPVGYATLDTRRGLDMSSLLDILNTQRAWRVDSVVPASKLSFADGMLIVDGVEPHVDDEGVTDANGTFWPTRTFDDQLAERLDITPGFLRRLRCGRVDGRGKVTAPPRLDLWDHLVNGLLHGRLAQTRAYDPWTDLVDAEIGPDGSVVVDPGVPADPRSFLVRTFKPEHGRGIGRALLSDKYAPMDNYDAVLAMLKGIADAGVNPDTLRIYGDLSESKMYIHVQAPEILALAPKLLEGYRSPFAGTGHGGVTRHTRGYTFAERVEMGRRWRESGRPGLPEGIAAGFEPLVHTGFLLANSETGGGRWTITPEMTVLECTNGAQMNKDGFGRTHLGSRLDEGNVIWSEDTQSKELALVSAQTRDVVKAALSVEYLERKVAELEAKSGRPIDEPEKVIEIVSRKLTFSKEEEQGILRHFLLGGQLSSGGVMQAVTSFSQTVADADAAHELNAKAVDAMELAFAARV